MDAEFTDAEWTREVLAVLESPLRDADLAALLGPVAAHIAQAIQDDCACFETENAGYLSGTEPLPTSFSDL